MIKKAEVLSYPESEYVADYRTDTSIIPGKEVLSYGRQVRSCASKPDRLKPCAEVYKAREMANKY